jgi:predicted regulator of Ras-like GTPase activity (Roadblock/LC7/MglB family)
MHIVGYVKVRLGLRRLNPPRQIAPTEELTSISIKNLQSAEQAFQVFNSPGNTSRPGLQNKESHTMAEPILLREQQYHQIKAVLARLRMDASAKVVFLVDKDGQEIASQGEVGNLDTTSLASLAAGNVAATGGMAQLIGEKEFPTLSHEGEKESIHISVVGRLLLVVVFDERSSLGLVKLRSKQVSQQLAAMFDEIAAGDYDDLDSPFAEITDEDIDSLFS